MSLSLKCCCHFFFFRPQAQGLESPDAVLCYVIWVAMEPELACRCWNPAISPRDRMICYVWIWVTCRLSCSVTRVVIWRFASASADHPLDFVNWVSYNKLCVCVSLFFWPWHAVWGILVPQLGIKAAPLAVEVWSLNHWTAREVHNHWNS